MASRSVCLFNHSSCSRPTDRQTHRPRYICSKRPHLCTLCMWCGIMIFILWSSWLTEHASRARSAAHCERWCSDSDAELSVDVSTAGASMCGCKPSITWYTLIVYLWFITSILTLMWSIFNSHCIVSMNSNDSDSTHRQRHIDHSVVFIRLRQCAAHLIHRP